MKTFQTTFLGTALLAATMTLYGCGDVAEEATGPTDGAATQGSGEAYEPVTSSSSDPEAARQAYADAEAPTVEAAVIGRDGNEIGNLSLEPVDQGVRISLHVEGLDPGPHAVHFHEHGRCEPPDFKSAGGHYNPAGAEHGMPDSDDQMDEQDHHAGDMLNQQVDDQQVLSTVLVNRTITLSDGPNTLLDADGSALIVHAQPDDYESQPAGDAGNRVACAVVVRQSATGLR